MLLKNVALAFAAMIVLTGSARAGDLMDDLATMNLDSINESAADVEEFDLASLDMDGLEAEAGTNDEETDAIETCFRRFGGYRSSGWNQWGGCRSYGHCFNNYYSCYRPVYHCYRPVIRHCYTSCYPVVSSYWGCY